jgi:hypothetical protein
MPRISKKRVNEARKGFKYIALRKEQFDALSRVIAESDCRDRGIENVTDLIKNFGGELLQQFEKDNNFIRSKEYADRNWYKNRFKEGRIKPDIEYKKENNQIKEENNSKDGKSTTLLI